MAVVTLTSASGSPGVTTTALALASTWPRPMLLVEADPTGGSGILAGWWRGTRNHPGLVDLVTAYRSGRLAETLPQLTLPIKNTDASVLVGSKSHEQAVGLARLWDPLTRVLADMGSRGQDILVDAGRLGLGGSPNPLVSGADLTLLVTRSSLPALAAARSWAHTLREDVLPGHDVGVLLAGAGKPYHASEVSRTLGLRVVGEISWDPSHAAVFAEGAPFPPARGWRRLVGGAENAKKSFAASPYMRTVRATGESIRAVLEDSTREALGAALTLQREEAAS